MASENDLRIETLTIPSPADFHVHLRQAELMNLVVPHLVNSGINLCYVMVSPFSSLQLVTSSV